ncbi:MAG: Txe/YoeB family addiction module toxin [Candidatus Electrothrix communis]|nr:MAG: Txe/YoeB family addiction module toxin [Candidatus Electrothrix communis]
MPKDSAKALQVSMKEMDWNESSLRLMNEDHLSSERLGGLFVLAERKQEDLKKINTLIKDIQRTPQSGLGKPEPLKFDFSGFWSRRIDHEHRLVYRVEEQELHILSCRLHY